MDLQTSRGRDRSGTIWARPRAELVVFGAWVTYVVVSLVLLDVLDGAAYAAVVVGGAAVMALATERWIGGDSRIDRSDLRWGAMFYVGVVVSFRLAFDIFTPERTAPMFICFAAGLVLGTVGPIVYTVWVRGRTLGSIGLGTQHLRTTVLLALMFGSVQFSITLWGYDLPAPIDWVPLLVMSLVVGWFESVFFRGFLQGRLEMSIGRAPGIAVAAVLYGLYHVGFGMGSGEIVFLTGLGVVYAVAYALCGNLLVLWPLLTPLGSFFAQLDSGLLVGELPWTAILGFADVAVIMIGAIILATRRSRRDHRPTDAEVLGSPDSGER